MLRRLLLAIISLAALSAPAAEQPPYLKEALSLFNPDIPAELAYTLTTQRGTETSVERFDPSLPDGRQWTLLKRNGLPATVEDNARYGSYRTTTAPSTRATFKRGDIDLNSLRLIREDADRAVYLAKFRTDLNDPMLLRLELTLTVKKQPAAIEHFGLRLTEPYSPVLTVKMLELSVETYLSAPIGDRPGLPQRVTSRFRGRVFLVKAIDEEVQTSYSDFVPVTPLARRPPASPP